MQGSEDKVERALLSLAADRRSVQGSGDDEKASHSAEWDTLAAPEWPGVPEKAMLLSPSRCRALWRQFTSDTNFIVQQVLNMCNYSKMSPYHPIHSVNGDVESGTLRVEDAVLKGSSCGLMTTCKALHPNANLCLNLVQSTQCRKPITGAAAAF